MQKRANRGQKSKKRFANNTKLNNTTSTGTLNKFKRFTNQLRKGSKNSI